MAAIYLYKKLLFINFFWKSIFNPFFGQKLQKMAKKTKDTLEGQLYFLSILPKSVENEKVSFSQMIKLSWSKKSLFLRKNGFLAIFGHFF